MTQLTRKDITRDFIRSKRPCTDGYRWYLKRQETLSDYQALLDDLVAAGRLDDANWLLDQLGPTDDVLRLDELDAPALVFAGSVECRGSMEVDGVLRTGRSLSVGGGVRAGSLKAGEDLRVSGALQCAGPLQVASDMRIGWSLQVAQALRCGGSLRVGWDVDIQGDVRVEGRIHAGHGVVVGGQLACQGGIRTGDDLSVTGAIEVAQGVESAGSVRTQSHLQCGTGVVATQDIEAGGAIRVGESLQAGGRIVAGPDYAVFAGLASPMDSWDSCGWVRAQEKPARLLSGWWAEV
ncbi:hypothetical protein [Hydrogenophaga atypica]|uniref:DUF342 domain-containing protein n=1 Tax=Hydrogenophaga atypica TaxID=249409 RepID=A0ABW2QQT2_9BURK